jgi:hypothetical protein
LKKYIILILALVVPVGLVFFLRNFGKNRFDLPVLYSNKADWPAECRVPGKFPFRVADTLLKVKNSRPTIFLFGDLPSESGMRLPVEIDTSEVQLNDVGRVEGAFTCRFGAPSGSGAVLIDSALQVRGVYKRLDRDEMDRLIMEVKILLNDY